MALTLAGLLGTAAPAWPQAAEADRDDIFADVAAEVGLDFHHFNGASGKLFFAEMMGPGGALVDYDGDGDLDAYLLQGRMLGPGETVADALEPPHHPLPLTDRLYRNDLHVGPDGAPVLRFTDVSERAGLAPGDYSMGVASGDFDNDGWVDLYVAAFGSNRLLRNRGDGTFEDVTAKAGADDPRWSVGATFFDYDRDGWLDLYVLNYVNFNPATNKFCPDPTGARDYCGPAAYRPVTDRLLRNRGDGTFENTSSRAGIDAEAGSGLGVVAADFDGDGRPDLYVGNDGQPNFLFLNQGDGTFADEALLAGCAVNNEGVREASMGIVAGDVDADGDEDLFMTHLNGETNTLYINDGRGLFRDMSQPAGVGTPSWRFTGFGTGLVDVDNDGLVDLVVANGAVTFFANQGSGNLDQADQLYRGLGGGRFEEVSHEAGATYTRPAASRGAAFGDVDNDGDIDILVVINGGPVRLHLNRVGQRSTWLGLRLLGPTGWDALGATARVAPAQGPSQWRRVHTDGSYASASDPRLLVGLGEEAAAVAVYVEGLAGPPRQLLEIPLRHRVDVPAGAPAARGGGTGSPRPPSPR